MAIPFIDTDPVGEPSELPALAGGSFAARALRSGLVPLAAADIHVLLCAEPGLGEHEWIEALAFRHGPGTEPVPVLRLNGHAQEQLEGLFFTGASARGLGAFPVGTLVHVEALDALSMECQRRLAQWVESQREPRIRIVASVGPTPEEHVRRGRLCARLHRLLGVVQLVIPPLRERREDVPAIAELWLRRHARTATPVVPPLDHTAAAALHDYAWPGNVDELENVLAAARALAPGAQVTGARIRAVLAERRRQLPSADVLSLAQVELDYIAVALERCAGNQTEAARRLGIGRSTLIRKMRKHGLGPS